MQGQQFGACFADLADAEGVDQPVQRNSASVVDRRHQVVDRLLAPAFALRKFCRTVVQSENICRRGNQPILQKGNDMPGAETLDIEGVARHEVLQPLDILGRADQATGATADRFAFRPDGVAAAGRAGFRENIGLRAVRPLVEQHLDYLGNDVAGALDDDGVAFPDLPALDLVFIVQSRPRDHDAADSDRGQIGNRRQRPGAADLDGDFVQHGLRPFRRELVGGGPARRAADHAEARLPVEPVHFVDDAVDIVGQGRPFGLRPIVQRYRFIDGAAEGGKAIDAEAPALEPFEEIPLCPCRYRRSRRPLRARPQE